MQRFSHDGVDIAFFDEGKGDPVVLVHGFASTAQVNWLYPGWTATVTERGDYLLERERPSAADANREEAA